MGITGYLEISEIPGESLRAEHEEQIDVHGAHWKIAQKSGTSMGSGLTQARAEVGSLTVYKWFDAASPYLAHSSMRGTAFPEMVLYARKDSGEAHLDYLTITMTNCIISSYEMQNDGEDEDMQMIGEKVSIAFEKVKILYTVQAEDGSAGDEHEIEYDVVAGS